MSRRTTLSLSIALVAALNTSASLAQTPQQIEEALRNERKTNAEQAEKDEPKLRAVGINPETDCPAIARLTGDNRKVASKTRGIVTIKQYRNFINSENIPGEEKKRLATAAEDQATILNQECKIVARIQEIDAQLVAGGSVPAQLSWTYSYGDAALEILGTLTGGYPHWTFRGTRRLQPEGPINQVECEGDLDAPEALPPRDAPGKMRCTAGWGEGDKRTIWQCPEHAYDQQDKAPRSAGVARDSSDGHWFFVMMKCQGSQATGQGAATPQEFYRVGISENKLGSDRDPPWK
jgi:hypothetical protein